MIVYMKEVLDSVHDSVHERGFSCMIVYMKEVLVA